MVCSCTKGSNGQRKANAADYAKKKEKKKKKKTHKKTSMCPKPSLTGESLECSMWVPHFCSYLIILAYIRLTVEVIHMPHCIYPHSVSYPCCLLHVFNSLLYLERLLWNGCFGKITLFRQTLNCSPSNKVIPLPLVCFDWAISSRFPYNF